MAQTVTVIGGGISGLVSAYRLAENHPVTLIEASDRLGGCLFSTTLDGTVPDGVDTGAEASLFRRPETADLARELGLELEFPSNEHGSSVYAGGKLSPIPKRTMMGVPAEPGDLESLLGAEAVARIAAEQLTDPIEGADVSVGEFLAERLGDELVDTLVDPLLSGVYAGRCRDLSLRATVPALLPAALGGTSVLDLVRSLVESRESASSASTEPAQPVFMSLRGGINRLVTALEEALRERGVHIILNSPVTSVARTGETWLMHAGESAIKSDALVIATGAQVTKDLLAEVAPRAKDVLERIPYASTALVIAAVDVSGAELTGSGFLVPASAGTFIKAATHVSNKWPWVKDRLPADTALIRMSIGRFGDEPGTWQDLDEDQLIARAFADWLRITGRDDGLRGAEVHYWKTSLPQYMTGHQELIADLDGELANIPSLGLVGSAYEGVGIPACIARATSVTRRLAENLGEASHAPKPTDTTINDDRPKEQE